MRCLPVPLEPRLCDLAAHRLELAASQICPNPDAAPVLIPKGRAVAYSVYSLHRRADLYGADAEDFQPEQWQEDLGLFRDEITTRWGYLPFNGGPRQCLGSK